MSGYSSQLKTALQFNLSEGQSHRGDCPFCFRKNVYTVVKRRGKLMWNCYSANCDVGGKHDAEFSLEDVSSFFETSEESRGVFSVPEHFVPVHGHRAALEYLSQNHCMEALVKRVADIRYDPKQHRVVFMVRRDGVIHDAVGRSIDRSVRPKWLRYGSSDLGFLARYPGSTDYSGSCVVVEDCASACAASSVLDSMALLGTSLSTSHVLELAQYGRVLIALDPDAFGKALVMQQRLCYYTKAEVVQLPDDLKYFGTEDIRRILDG